MRQVLTGLLLLMVATTAIPTATYADEPKPDGWKRRLVKAWIREAVVEEKDLARYGLEIDRRCQSCLAARKDRPLVVLVHGYNSKSQRHSDFSDVLRAAELPCATFCYPNDQPLGDSAELLSEELRAFRAAHPHRRVALVTHSMGGLVARACVEDPDLDPGCVTKLIMIAPPNHGTLLAHYSLGTDVCEHFVTRGGGSPLARLRASIADGLGEATDDLEPGSEFLTKLNARPRHPQVRYTILLGTGGKIYRSELDLARKMVGYGEEVPLLDRYAERLDRHLREMDELVAGHGDGVVAVKRGCLKGVRDTVVYPFEHVSVTGSADEEAVAEVQQAVLDRLLAP